MVVALYLLTHSSGSLVAEAERPRYFFAVGFGEYQLPDLNPSIHPVFVVPLELGALLEALGDLAYCPRPLVSLLAHRVPKHSGAS